MWRLKTAEWVAKTVQIISSKFSSTFYPTTEITGNIHFGPYLWNRRSLFWQALFVTYWPLLLRACQLSDEGDICHVLIHYIQFPVCFNQLQHFLYDTIIQCHAFQYGRTIFSCACVAAYIILLFTIFYHRIFTLANMQARLKMVRPCWNA